jgi:hypothetical protein
MEPQLLVIAYVPPDNVLAVTQRTPVGLEHHSALPEPSTVPTEQFTPLNGRQIESLMLALVPDATAVVPV